MSYCSCFICAPFVSAVEATLKATAEATHKTGVCVQYVYCSSRSFIGYTLWDVGIIMLHFLNKVKPCMRLVACVRACVYASSGVRVCVYV